MTTPAERSTSSKYKLQQCLWLTDYFKITRNGYAKWQYWCNMYWNGKLVSGSYDYCKGFMDREYKVRGPIRIVPIDHPQEKSTKGA